MAGDRNKNYTDILLEDINDKFQAVLEAVGSMQDSVKKIPKMAERIEKLEYEMGALKIAARVASDNTQIIKIRTEKLEDVLEDVTNLQKRVKTLESTT